MDQISSPPPPPPPTDVQAICLAICLLKMHLLYQRSTSVKVGVSLCPDAWLLPPSSSVALILLLKDPSPLVRSSCAEAMSLLYEY